jgi:two-component system sensor histidine kinase KdpD
MRVVNERMRSPLAGIGAGLVLIAAVTGLIELLDSHVPVLSLGVLYLFAVVPVALVWGTWQAITVAIGSMLAFNFFFLPPLYTFTIADRRNWLALLVNVAVAAVVGTLASRTRAQRQEAQQREQEAALLADIAVELLRGTRLEDELPRIETRTAALLGVSSARIVLRRDAAPHTQEDPHELEVDGRRLGICYLPENEEPPFAVQRRLLPALASLLAVAQERERLAAQALEAEALRRSDTIKTAVIQAASHDLRTPLATIEQALGGLESGDLALTDADRQALLETIRVEHTRLKRLVENLLDLSRLQADAARAAPELWTGDELVAQALEEIGPGRERVQVTSRGDLPAVRVDAGQVQRVLVNLIENALRFSPEEEPVHIRVSATRKELLIRVTDHGPGVPEDERERIFEPFQRVAGRGDRPGAGLGLAIARGFAEANDGRVWLESREGQGASFVVALPAVEIPVPA